MLLHKHLIKLFRDDYSNGNPVTGDCWDYVAYDPDNKLVLSVVPGKKYA